MCWFILTLIPKLCMCTRPICVCRDNRAGHCNSSRSGFIGTVLDAVMMMMMIAVSGLGREGEGEERGEGKSWNVVSVFSIGCSS